MLKKKNSRRKRSEKRDLSDIEKKINSARSKKFRGGMPSNGRESGRNGLVYAKALPAMPDYSNEATRATERQVGVFEYDEDES